jgi:hypothetical protein
MADKPTLSGSEQLERYIHFIRGHRVMLAPDLARLFGVATKRLNEQVKRNLDRFPEDFMFQLTADEHVALRSQFATSKGKGGTRYLPYAFTEHGTVMLANVLNSPTAVKASIEVVRAFIRLRQMLVSQQALARKLAALERKYDGQFQVVFEAIRELMTPPEPKKKQRIGF